MTVRRLQADSLPGLLHPAARMAARPAAREATAQQLVLDPAVPSSCRVESLSIHAPGCSKMHRES